MAAHLLRAHRFDTEGLALDLAGFDYIFRKRGQTGLITQDHADVRQSAQQNTLGTTNLRHRPRQYGQVEAPVRPIAGLPDIGVIAAIHAEIMGRIRRMRKSITAHGAVIRQGLPPTSSEAFPRRHALGKSVSGLRPRSLRAAASGWSPSGR